MRPAGSGAVPAPWAVVPVKAPARAKRRLSSLLDAGERDALVFAMLDDVLAALRAARSIDGILVVTADARVAAVAQRHGATPLRDETAGLCAAVSSAALRLSGTGRGMLVVPADLPQLEPAMIDTIVGAHGSAPAVTLVPAAVDGGTNALLCTPPDVIAPCFGPGSFDRHREAARRAGIAPTVLAMPAIADDIDRPADLVGFARTPSATATYRWLAASGVLRRASGSPQRVPCDPHRLRTDLGEALPEVLP